MITVGVIGYGYWGPNLVRNFTDHPGSAVRAICDLDAERLAGAGRRYPLAQLTTQYDDLLTDSAIDAIVIATPVYTHFDLGLQALRAGKHVLIEKPLASSSDQARQLIDEADGRGLTLMVDHTFVYTGAVRKIKDIAVAGELGDLLYYDSVRVNLGLFQHDINVLWDLAVHDLAIMDYLLPEQPTGVSATGLAHLAGEPENIAYLTMYFAGRLIAHVHVNWLAPVKIRRTLIGGSQRMVVYDDLEASEKIRVYDTGVSHDPSPANVYEMLVGYRTGDMWAPRLGITEALYTEAGHFLECIERQQRPTTDGQAGLRVVRLLEAANQSLAEQGRFVRLDRSS